MVERIERYKRRLQLNETRGRALLSYKGTSDEGTDIRNGTKGYKFEKT
jgi:hypothetical protein